MEAMGRYTGFRSVDEIDCNASFVHAPKVWEMGEAAGE
jgi:hypothetical protein